MNLFEDTLRMKNSIIIKLNIDKTHYIIFTRRPNAMTNFDVMINNVPINKVEKTKFLGIIIDSKLNWKEHIALIRNKVSKGIGIINKTKGILNKITLRNLYETFIKPYLSYCNIVWGNAPSSYLDCLLKLQKRIVRIIAGEHYRAHTEHLFKDLNIMNVYQLNVYLTCIFVFKHQGNILPDIFTDLFVKNESIHNYNTRSNILLHTPACHSNLGKRNIRYHGAILWNKILNNPSINFLCTLGQIKYQLKEYILYNYDSF